MNVRSLCGIVTATSAPSSTKHPGHTSSTMTDVYVIQHLCNIYSELQKGACSWPGLDSVPTQAAMAGERAPDSLELSEEEGLPSIKSTWYQIFRIGNKV